MLPVSFERIADEDLIATLFAREDSQKAAATFLDWFRSLHGRCTKSEMSQFSHLLSLGKGGSRLSRTNFYGTILRRFVELGLVAEQLEYDYQRRKTVEVYRAVIQPIGSRRPVAPSLAYLAHIMAEKWNLLFTTEEVRESGIPGELDGEEGG